MLLDLLVALDGLIIVWLDLWWFQELNVLVLLFELGFELDNFLPKFLIDLFKLAILLSFQFELFLKGFLFDSLLLSGQLVLLFLFL